MTAEEGVCRHGKRLYPSRREARKAARLAHGHHLREYRCDHVEGYWHIGHVAHDVVRGNMTADEIFKRDDE
jgi:hypothetical protein